MSCTCVPLLRRGLCWLAGGVLGLGVAGLPATALADSGDGTLTVVVNRDVDGDGEYAVATDRPQPGIEVTVSDAGGAAVHGITDDLGRVTVLPGPRLTGGRYFVVATVPSALGDLSPLPASTTFAAFSTSVDVSLGAQTVRMGVAPRTLETLVSPPTVPAPVPTPPVAPVTRYAVGDLVWKDLNASGTLDPGEPGVAGVAVQLLDSDARLLASTVTSSTGHYVFDRLAEGTYAVRFAGLPPGYKLDPAGAGRAAGADSDPDASGLTPPFNLGADDANLRPATTEDRLDADRLDPTVDAGLVPLTFAVASRVWLDQNRDGVRQPAEPPAAATVSLLTAGGAILATVGTDPQGRYVFSGLEAGRYRLRFDGIGAARGFTVPSTGAGGSAVVAPRTGTTGVVELGQGGRNLVPADTVGVTGADFVDTTLGAGLVSAYSLGGAVWLDDNGDGVRQPHEDGVAGVPVSLVDENGRALASRTTTRTGAYAFEGLAPGVYRVRARRFPPGLVVTGRGRGGDPTVDSDAGPDGRTGRVMLSEENPAAVGLDVGLRQRDRAAADLGSAGLGAEPLPAPAAAETLPGTGGAPLPLLLGALGVLGAVAGAVAGGFAVARRLRRCPRV